MATAPSVRILLIEDNPGDARLIRVLLAEDPGQRFQIVVAEDLAAGFACLAKGGFHVVLLDLSLPDSVGLATLHALQAHPIKAPVVVLTGLNDEDVGLRAVSDGAQDFLVKGQVDARRLVHSLTYALGRSRRVQKLEETYQSTQEEMRLARRVQQQLFPKAAPACPGFDIHGLSLPAGAAGGDYFDYLTSSDGRLKLVIGDVAGHGIGPALIMATTRAYLRAFAQTYDDVGRILTLVNHALVEDSGAERDVALLYVTLLLGHVDLHNRTLVYSSAGHQTGYIMSSAGAVKAELLSTDIPLGILADGNYVATPPIPLEPGDIVFMYTDGVVEAFSPTGVQFGRDRVLEVLRANRNRRARELVDEMCLAVRQHAQDRPQADDVTMIVIKVGDS